MLTFEQCKAAYVHRFTAEFIPQWAMVPHDHPEFGKVYYAPQYASDAEWFSLSEFPKTLGSAIPGFPRGSCYSKGQTWPCGKGFFKSPYRQGQSHPVDYPL